MTETMFYVPEAVTNCLSTDNSFTTKWQTRVLSKAEHRAATVSTDVQHVQPCSLLSHHPFSPLSLQDIVCDPAGGCGVSVSAGHSPAWDQTGYVFLWFAVLQLLNVAVL